MLAPINDDATRTALTCERAFLAALDGSCRTPIAGLATIADGALSFSGMILSPDGKATFEISRAGEPGKAAEIGTRAGEAIRAEAGPDFFESWS